MRASLLVDLPLVISIDECGGEGGVVGGHRVVVGAVDVRGVSRDGKHHAQDQL